MPITVLSEWFLLVVDKYIAALNELRLRFFNACTSISIALARLFLQLMKRTIGIIKNWLKESKIEEWLKASLHESYLSVIEDLYIVLYFLHFFRAFLTLVEFFSDQDNKNLVEIYKFLYACFKVFISVLMLTFLIVMIAYGLAPLGLLTYNYIKDLFRIYTFSKFAINFITLGFSFYQLKTCDDNPDHEWLKTQYRNNFKKHLEILLIGGLITLAITIISLGLVTGVWLWIMVGVASSLLLFDMAKAIYYHVNSPKVPEPKSLTQQNALIDYSIKNYYYRKCRTARLKSKDPEGNRIYLLKEIIVKILQLKIKLKNCSSSRLNFFSETSKILKKIEGLKQLANTLLEDEYENNTKLFNKVLNALQEDVAENKNNKTSIPKKVIENFIKETNANFEITILAEILYARDRLGKKDITPSQLFKQSFFRKKGDCEDISDACQKLKELERSELGTETRWQIFPVFPVRSPGILVAG